ncbi:myelin protein zero-like protein 1 isoform X4 [Anomalospiza imberbis]|uniref:myelin protein zero-like protein 1 isoform X4 n=1 Tax=Anomalospiza imberbis TaxID=187417 RepID=UPI003590177F
MRAPRGGGGGWKMAAGGGSAGRPCAAWLLVAAAALSAVQVSAVEVNTPEEMFVENGTDAKLPCTFTSVEVISSAASVSWSFQPEGAATRISFFYYSNGKSYPGKDIPFKDRITWAGDLNKKDASITISNMQFRDNGTYICDVKNPPDIVVKPGEIRVRVVEKDSLPAFPIATVAGIAIGTVTGLSSLISIVVCLVIRKNNSKKRYSGTVVVGEQMKTHTAEAGTNILMLLGKEEHQEMKCKCYCWLLKYGKPRWFSVCDRKDHFSLRLWLSPVLCHSHQCSVESDKVRLSNSF